MYSKDRQGYVQGLLPCYYCGLPATSIDHFIPQVLTRRLLYVEDQKLIPACKECNSILGARFFRTLELRRAAAKDGIRKKYARILRLPDWTEEECQQLGPTLKSKIETNARLKALTRLRLAYYGALSVGLSSPKLGDSNAIAGLPADGKPTWSAP